MLNTFPMSRNEPKNIRWYLFPWR